MCPRLFRLCISGWIYPTVGAFYRPLTPRFLRRSEPLISVAAAWHRAVIKPWAAIGNQGLAASPRGDRCRGALAAGRGSRFSISMAPFRRERGACAGHGGSSTCLPLSAIMRRVAWYGTARAANRARPPSLLGHRRRGISRPLGLGQFILLCNVKLHVSHVIATIQRTRLLRRSEPSPYSKYGLTTTIDIRPKFSGTINWRRGGTHTRRTHIQSYCSACASTSTKSVSLPCMLP